MATTNFFRRGGKHFHKTNDYVCIRKSATPLPTPCLPSGSGSDGRQTDHLLRVNGARVARRDDAMKYDVAKHNVERVITLPDAEIGDRYLAGETIAELAAAYGVSRPTLAKALDRKAIPRRAAKPRPTTMAGDRNPSWNGGRHQRKDGYWLVWTPNGERLEHRVIMEIHIGRTLRIDEIVHHIDGDRSNNDPSNLKVMSQSEHIRHHASEMHTARYGYER